MRYSYLAPVSILLGCKQGPAADCLCCSECRTPGTRRARQHARAPRRAHSGAPGTVAPLCAGPSAAHDAGPVPRDAHAGLAGRCRATCTAARHTTPGSRGGAARRARRRGMRVEFAARLRAAAKGHAMRLCPPTRSRAADEALRGTRRDCVLRLLRVLRLRGTRRACGVQPVRTVHAVRGTAIVTRRRSPCSRSRHDREKRFGCCEGVRMGQNLGFADAGHTLPSACACTEHTLPSDCACVGHTLTSAGACAGHTLPSACTGHTLTLCQARAGHTLPSLCVCRAHSAKCAGHTLTSVCACMHALLCYPASAGPAYRTEPQHVCTDPHPIRVV